MSIDFHKELNQEQLDAVLHGDGPCLVLAGAGSGKTRTVTYRVAYLLEQGADPSSILLLTFTNKAAREMLDRIGTLVGPGAHGVWGGTFHAVGNRLLRTFADAAGYTNKFTILDEDDAKILLKAVLKDAKIDPKVRRFPSPAVIHHLASYARNTGQSIGQALEIKNPSFMDCQNDIEFVISQYQTRKREANAMDFDDLLANWLGIMETRPEIAHVIGSRFKYVLVDEYQDTNALQCRIVGQVAKAHGNVFAVGDDAQSIYAFRGADVKNILAFPSQWPGARIFKLLSNYRSTPQILDVANASLKNNANQYEKELIGLKAAGIKPTVVTCVSARQEASFIADQILLLRNQGVALANMAALFRASSHSQALEFELMKRNIPFEYRGGVRFFERAHVKDALAYLRLIDNPKDETAWLRVLSMQVGIGAASSAQIMSRIRVMDETDVFLMDASQVPARASQGWNEARGMFSLMRADESPKPGMMLRAVSNSEAYKLYLEREYPDWKDRVEDLEQLASFADAYTDVAAFLSDATLESANFAATAGQNTGRGTMIDGERMVLSTIHQAKGLEWDTVFVIHLTNLGFPNPKALEDENAIEEERRLFYVAVTRARNRLLLSYPQTAGYDSMSFCRPSMFLEELPPYLTERFVMPSAGSGWSSSASSVKSPRFSDQGDNGWSDEEVIQVGSDGEVSRPSVSNWRKSAAEQPKSVSVWKKPEQKKEAPRLSFLRDVEDL